MLRVDKALCPLLGRGAEELVGRSILDFTHPEDRQRSVEKRESTVDGVAEAAFVKRYVRPDGSVVEAIVTIALVEPDVGEPYFYGVQAIAAGIEGHTQLDALRDLGCPMGQGFLFAKPLPLADANRLLLGSGNRAWPTRERAAERPVGLRPWVVDRTCDADCSGGARPARVLGCVDVREA